MDHFGAFLTIKNVLEYHLSIAHRFWKKIFFMIFHVFGDFFDDLSAGWGSGYRSPGSFFGILSCWGAVGIPLKAETHPQTLRSIIGHHTNTLECAE